MKKIGKSAMIEIQKRRTTIGRLLLHMLGDLTAHDGSRAVIFYGNNVASDENND